MSSSPDTPHYLCSQLVELFSGGKTQWVNLEEIWRDGALLECEEAVAIGAEAAILAGEAQLRGVVSRVDQDEFGWQAEVTFSDGAVWSIETWKPSHLLAPRDLEHDATGGSPSAGPKP
jgi:hypothetical protein